MGNVAQLQARGCEAEIGHASDAAVSASILSRRRMRRLDDLHGRETDGHFAGGGSGVELRTTRARPCEVTIPAAEIGAGRTLT